MVYSNYPMGFNILFTPGVMLGQLSFAGLLQFTTGLLSGLMMACLASRHISRMAALWMLPVFFAIPLVQDESTWPMVDLGLTFYTVQAFAALIRWHVTRRRPLLALAGLLLGFSCSIKFTAIISVASFGIILLGSLWSAHPRRWRDWPAPLIAFGIPLLAFGAPWYVKTYAMTGNPFLPYFYDVFAGRYWSPQANERYLSYLYSLGLQLPVAIRTVLSVAALAMTSLIVLRARLQPAIKMLVAFLSLWLVFFLFSGSLQERFLLPLYPMVLFLLLWAFSVVVIGLQSGYRVLARGRGTSHPLSPRWLDRLQQRKLETPVYSIVSLIVLASLLRMFVTKGDLLAVGLGREDREAFLARRMYLYKADRFANDYLPDSATIFLFPDCRSVYLEVPFLRGDPIMQVFVDYSELNTPRELLENLRELGVTHILVSYPAYEYYKILLEAEPASVAYTEHAMELIGGLESLGSEIKFVANGVTVFALP
jgi:4-amino-4-deoxy-L-arabinose transferase-like glycosyltransferase